MFVLVVFCLALSNLCSGIQEIIPNQYCADMQPQAQVLVDQLMGMWYGVEIISHKPDEEHGIKYLHVCPVIHISEDYTPTSEMPYGTDFGYGYNYRDDKPESNYQTQQNRRVQPYANREQRYGGDRHGGDRYGGDRYGQGRYGTVEGNRMRHIEEKRLKIIWDENGKYIEYSLRYDQLRPGFWKSSGPQNGSLLEPQFNHFAGTVQVLKAVDDHLVLNFCHQLPERHLYTVLLSRMPEHLRDPYISSIHSMLHRKGLTTNSIKKVCRSDSSRTSSGSRALLGATLVSVFVKLLR